MQSLQIHLNVLQTLFPCLSVALNQSFKCVTVSSWSPAAELCPETLLLQPLHGACQDLDPMQVTISSPEHSRWTRNKVKCPSEMSPNTREMSGAPRCPFRGLLGMTLVTSVDTGLHSAKTNVPYSDRYLKPLTHQPVSYGGWEYIWWKINSRGLGSSNTHVAQCDLMYFQRWLE